MSRTGAEQDGMPPSVVLIIVDFARFFSTNRQVFAQRRIRFARHRPYQTLVS